MAEGSVGLSVGAYNLDELAEFQASLFAQVPVVQEVPEGFQDLAHAARGRSSTIEILRWQMEGQLRHTRRIGSSLRIDSLRFSLEEIRTLLRARSRTDLHRLTDVAIRLGVLLEVVKRLVSAEDGPPLLALVPPQECQGLRGRGYVSSSEIDRFKADYLTLARAAEAIGMHASSARVFLDGRLAPVRDPAALGVRLYRRADVEEFIARNGDGFAVPTGSRKRAPDGSKRAGFRAEMARLCASGESDGSIR